MIKLWYAHKHVGPWQVIITLEDEYVDAMTLKYYIATYLKY